MNLEAGGIQGRRDLYEGRMGFSHMFLEFFWSFSFFFFLLSVVLLSALPIRSAEAGGGSCVFFFFFKVRAQQQFTG